MKLQHAFTLLAVAVCVTSCNTNYSFGHRDPNCNPDERLEGLVRAYDECHDGNENYSNGIIFDCSEEWLAIERLATEFPRHVPTLMANAVIAYDERDRVKSKRYLDALFSIENSHPTAAVLRSRVAIDEGNMPLARRVIETQLAYTPNDPSVREAYSSVLYMSKDLEGATREIAVAEKQGAPAWRVAYNRGLIAEAAGRGADAQRQFQAALDANPEFAPARARLTSTKGGS
jgi:tetratricopeptide (TPR) repeat protein